MFFLADHTGHGKIYYSLFLQLLNRSAESLDWQLKTEWMPSWNRLAVKWIVVSPGKNNNTHSNQARAMTNKGISHHALPVSQGQHSHLGLRSSQSRYDWHNCLKMTTEITTTNCITQAGLIQNWFCCFVTLNWHMAYIFAVPGLYKDY